MKTPKKQVPSKYAGAEFQSSPNPSALPIPLFTSSQKSNTQSAERAPHIAKYDTSKQTSNDMFVMDDYTNQQRPTYAQQARPYELNQPYEASYPPSSSYPQNYSQNYPPSYPPAYNQQYKYNGGPGGMNHNQIPSQSYDTSQNYNTHQSYSHNQQSSYTPGYINPSRSNVGGSEQVEVNQQTAALKKLLGIL